LENKSINLKDVDKLNNENNILTTPNQFKKIIKKEETLKNENESIPKQGSLMDLFDKDRIKKEIEQEFEKIINDLDDLEKYSNYTIKTANPSVEDDLRVSILDFTIIIETKKN